MLSAVARDIALYFGLPWDLVRLQDEGKQGIEEANKNLASNPGTPLDQFAYKYVCQAAKAAGRRIRAQRDAGGEKTPSPTSRQVANALKVFSAQDWAKLIAGFQRGDLEVLRAYMLENLDELERNLDLCKLNTIRVAVPLRGVQLAFSNSPRLVHITAPMYVQQWQDEARYRNLTGASPPSNTGRSWDEMGRPPAIAESLGTSSHMVRKMRERMEQVPFEKFDGDIYDYWLWVVGPKAYKRRQSSGDGVGK